MFQCKDILSLTTMSQVEVAAGSGGMTKEIRWAYKAENLNFDKWVQGNELLIISAPVIQRKNFDLYNIINKAIELNMSSALILIGENYVEEIDGRVKELADKNNFPIFTLPWNVPLLDFFEELGHAIAYLDDRKNVQDSFVAEIIFGNGDNINSISHKCKDMGYETSVLGQIFIMHLEGLSNDEVRTDAKILHGMFEKRDIPTIVTGYGNRIIGFMNDCRSFRDKINEIFGEFRDFLLSTDGEITYYLNIGEKCDSIENLHRNFRDTSAVNGMLMHIKRKNETVFYDQIGIYRFLMSYDNKKPMEKLVEEELGSLISYDSKNHSSLIETLYAYLKNDCNMVKTAEYLFTHKNTIKYRLSRIEDITKKQLDNSFQLMELYMALVVYDYIRH